jgi:hypothetical protein
VAEMKIKLSANDAFYSEYGASVNAAQILTAHKVISALRSECPDVKQALAARQVKRITKKFLKKPFLIFSRKKSK